MKLFLIDLPQQSFMHTAQYEQAILRINAFLHYVKTFVEEHNCFDFKISSAKHSDLNIFIL